MVHAMASQRLNRVIDLKNAHQGVTTVNITPDSIPTPSGIRVTMIQPSEIDITIEKIVSHIVKVEPIIQGKVADGYEIKKIDVVPKIIEVFGPASEIKKIKDVRTNTVNIEGKSKTYNEVSGLYINNSKITSYEPKKVTVLVQIKPVMGEASFKKVPINGLKENMITSTKAVTVTIKGPVLQLKNMQPEHISVNIPDKNFGPGSHSVIPEIVLPKGFELIKITPQKIKITLPNMK
jgi:YbbR domain-containing protein